MKFPDSLTNTLVKCPYCGDQRWHRSSSLWRCGNGHDLRTVMGIPDFTNDQLVSQRDKALQSRLYNGLLGRYYGFMMPLLSMPARPFGQSLPQWSSFFAAWVVVITIIFGWMVNLAVRPAAALWLFTFFLALMITFLNQHRYLFWLLVLAVPVKVNMVFRQYRPDEPFPEVHRRWINRFKESDCGRILDVSTGTCNSLLRHGWTELDAEFYGLDLSPVMLVQGADNAAQAHVSVNLYVGDAQALPLPDECMDLVLNYGALNGYSDQAKALSEMARVLKPGGFLVCLDEQLYPAASRLEALYFDRVLAAHDKIKKFPAESVPGDLVVVENHQIYQFYYLALMQKNRETS